MSSFLFFSTQYSYLLLPVDTAVQVKSHFHRVSDFPQTEDTNSDAQMEWDVFAFPSRLSYMPSIIAYAGDLQYRSLWTFAIWSAPHFGVTAQFVPGNTE